MLRMGRNCPRGSASPKPWRAGTACPRRTTGRQFHSSWQGSAGRLALREISRRPALWGREALTVGAWAWVGPRPRGFTVESLNRRPCGRHGLRGYIRPALLSFAGQPSSFGTRLLGVSGEGRAALMSDVLRNPHAFSYQSPFFFELFEFQSTATASPHSTKFVRNWCASIV